ncbi:uncharacterized protein RJT20DRAFT_89905 [Scheffersomyces xylosifermentans]|uniref:uncharacterized protein n=1 Tax=Scheffersomyces xylosifermentans TaxID=1304137 RepID=UPI00315D2FC7
MLNKNIISNLNKSLKAKQKIINNREPHPKNTSFISDIINTSPQSTIFPNNITSSNPTFLNPNSSTTNLNLPVTISQSSNTANAAPVSTLTDVVNEIGNDATASSTVAATSSKPQAKGKHKKISKQNSTRTDFFAAKLASAVDDVDSSDSDETFVYENNNMNEYDTLSNTIVTNNANIGLNDNSSVHGSVMAINLQGAPSFHSPSIAESQANNDSQQESIPVSAHLSKVPRGNRPPSIANSFSSNHYMENIVNNATGNKDKRPMNQRSFSSYSQDEHPGNKLQLPSERSSSNHSPSGALIDISNPHQNTNQGIGYVDGARNYHPSTTTSQVAQSINEAYNDDNYSYNEVDDVDNLIDDETSTDGDFYAQRTVSSNNNHLNPQFNAGGVSNTPTIIHGQSGNTNASQTNNSINSKGTSKKNPRSSTTSSSKLRSTTSKLFDKKGSQPRRYSIIPDDIDIEDFDDDLIYYDNNIRFPYNNSNLNEASPLINQGHRLPHYRSLNLNFPGVKRPSILKKKRYLSTGQPLLNDSAGVESPDLNNNPNNLNADVFPFNYQEPQGNYYYDFDEYDEESQIDGSPNDNDMQIKRSISGAKNGHYGHNRLNSNSGHFFLPRKQSNEFKGRQRVNCIKSFIYTLISIVAILGIGFIMGFVLATTKDLTHVSITTIENAVVSQDELIFNIVVEAFNPGWFTVEIEEVELDIFAKSGYLSEYLDLKKEGPEDEIEGLSIAAVETVLLGTVYSLESPMSFAGGFFSRESVVQSGEIKLLTPGKNLTTLSMNEKKHKEKEGGNNGNENGGNSTEPDNSKKWEIISRNPFDLVVRGLLMYRLPMVKDTKSVIVDKVGYIDPTLLYYGQEEK